MKIGFLTNIFVVSESNFIRVCINLGLFWTNFVYLIDISEIYCFYLYFTKIYVFYIYKFDFFDFEINFEIFLNENLYFLREIMNWDEIRNFVTFFDHLLYVHKRK